MSIEHILKTTLAICSVTATNFLLLLTSQATLANPTNLESWQIFQPTIAPNWLSMGKLLFHQSSDRLSLSIPLLNGG